MELNWCFLEKSAQRISQAGKQRGPAYPWTEMCSMSMLPCLTGLHSFSKTNLPELLTKLANVARQDKVGPLTQVDQI